MNREKGFLVLTSSIFILDAQSTKIGRHFVNDCVIADPHISRQHAKIDHEDDKYVIYDLGSRSGTFINHRKIDRHVLRHGDIIVLGNYSMIFMRDQINIFN